MNPVEPPQDSRDLHSYEPSSTLAPQPTQPQALSANSLALANRPDNSKKILWYVIDCVLFLAILVVIFGFLPKKSTPAKSTAKTSTTGSTSVIPNPINNPLNSSNGDVNSINSEVQYCANPLAGSTIC